MQIGVIGWHFQEDVLTVKEKVAVHAARLAGASHFTGPYVETVGMPPMPPQSFEALLQSHPDRLFGMTRFESNHGKFLQKALKDLGGDDESRAIDAMDQGLGVIHNQSSSPNGLSEPTQKTLAVGSLMSGGTR